LAFIFSGEDEVPFPRSLVLGLRRLALAALVAVFSPAVANAQGQPIDGGAYWIWTGMDQGTCLSRAVVAMQAAAGAFQIPATAQNPAGWYVALVGTGDVNAGVHCIPDNDTTNLIGSGRVLMVITFSSTRGGVTSGDFLRFVDQCVQTGTCPGSVSTSLVGNWSHPGGWGDITIWEDGGRFRGSYTSRCPGATLQGGFDLGLVRTADAQRYDGFWGDDVCNGEISISLYANGNVEVQNTWPVNRSDPNWQPRSWAANPFPMTRR
jgi:hypothetical protein